MSSAPDLSMFRLHAGTHHLIHRRNVGVVVVSCLRLVGTDNVDFNDHRRRMDAVSQSLGKLTGRLGVPVVTLSRLGHNIRTHRKTRKGHPRLTSLHRSNTVRRSTSVIYFVRHPRCCGVARSRHNGSLVNLTRVVVTGRHGNTIKSMHLHFGDRFTGFVGISRSIPIHRFSSGVGDSNPVRAVPPVPPTNASFLTPNGGRIPFWWFCPLFGA